MNHMVSSLVISASVALAAYALSEPGTSTAMAADALLPPNAVAPDPAYLAAYQDCSEQAEKRILSHAEAAQCLDAYLRLKLSFLPDMNMGAFLQLDPEDRWAVNMRGYDAYVAWKAGARSSM